MKKIIWTLGGLVAVIVIGALVVPNFVDWNSYKSDISSEVKKLTGRDLTIAGNISFKVLPAPVLIAEKVSLGSIEGAKSPDLAALKSVEVRIALAPLLGGNISVETVRLVEPRIYLEVLADGRATWAIEKPEAAPASAPDTGASDTTNGGASGPGVAIGNFEIVDGLVLYQDAASGTDERIEDINLTVGAASLASGPYRANGSLVTRGFRLGISTDTGEIVGGRTFPLDLKVSIGGESATIALGGTVLGLNDAPRFKGDIKITSPNVGRVVSALADNAALPAPLSQAFTLSGALDASAAALKLDELNVDFGGAKGSGKVEGTFNGTPKINATLNIAKIDADPWLVTKTVKPANDGQTDAAPAQKAVSNPTTSPEKNAFALPSGIGASLNVTIGEVVIQGERITNAVLDAELANGELTIAQMSMNAPGSTKVSAYGFLTAKKGEPSFDGQLKATVGQAPMLLRWAGVDMAALKPGKPATLSLDLDATATPSSVSVRKLNIGVDKTNISGAATLALRDRLGIGASVAVDQLDLDQYLASGSSAPKAKPSGNETTQTQTGAPAPKAKSGVFDALKPLATFDANVRANVGALKVSGIPIRDVNVDMSLVQGNLTINKFVVANALSSSLSASGQLLNLGKDPTAKALALRMNVADVGPAASLAGIDLPISAKSIGKVGIAADINGGLGAPTVKSEVNALAATLNTDGQIFWQEPANMLDVGVRLRHADTMQLLRKFGVAYRPSGKIGGLDISTRVKGGLSDIKLSNIVSAIGNVRIGGDADVALAGPRPRIVTTLKTNDIVVDPFLPAQKSASYDPGPARVVPARFVLPPDGKIDFKHLIASISQRWPTTPVDLSGLKAADVDLTLTAPSVSYHEYKLEGAKLLAGINNGVLNVSDFSGLVFGGAFLARASADASGPRPKLGSVLTLANMDIGEASKAAGIAGTKGKLTTRVDVITAGYSVADWIGALNGKGAVEVRGIKGESSLSDMPVVGLALGPLMQIFELLNGGLGSLIGAGNKTKLGETDLTGSFTISNGTVNTTDTKIISNVYEGKVAGDINLPSWTMNVGGEVSVDQGLLGAVLANVARVPSRIPFQVTGDMDKPNVKIQSFGGGSAGGTGIKIPGLDKLEQKVPGVGGLLQGILGGGSSGSTTPSAPPTQGSTGGSEPPPQQPQPQQQQKQVIDPARLLKGLFGN